MDKFSFLAVSQFTWSMTSQVWFWGRAWMWGPGSNVPSPRDRPYSSALCFQTPWICVLPLIMWAIRFHTHTTPIHSYLYLPMLELLMLYTVEWYDGESSWTYHLIICLGVLRKITKDLNQDLQLPGLDLYVGSREGEAAVLTTWPQRFVFPVMFCFTLRGAYLPTRLGPFPRVMPRRDRPECQIRDSWSKQSGVTTWNVDALSCTAQLRVLSSDLAQVVDICPLFRRSSQSEKERLMWKSCVSVNPFMTSNQPPNRWPDFLKIGHERISVKVVRFSA
jgi:hypothetical protein